jgi:glutathione-regulated potassium-efflux system ancillary protein KefF
MSDTLILLAHPTLRHSRVNATLVKAVMSAGERLADTALPQAPVVRDLYALYPDFFIDVAAEQAALQKATLIVWQHPLHWYSMPALMKLWVDEVLRFGWAYGPDGTALRGKRLWPVLSTGGNDDSYSPSGHNQHPFDAFLPPYRQTAALCGMQWVEPLVLHGAHHVSDSALAAHTQQYLAGLARFAQPTGNAPGEPQAPMPDHATPEVPVQARPRRSD